MASRYFAAGKIRAGWFHGRKLSQHKQERALLLLHLREGATLRFGDARRAQHPLLQILRRAG